MLKHDLWNAQILFISSQNILEMCNISFFLYKQIEPTSYSYLALHVQEYNST